MFTNIRQHFSDAAISHITFPIDVQFCTVTIFTKKVYIRALFNLHGCPFKLFCLILLIKTCRTCRSNAVTVFFLLYIEDLLLVKS